MITIKKFITIDNLLLMIFKHAFPSVDNQIKSL